MHVRCGEHTNALSHDVCTHIGTQGQLHLATLLVNTTSQNEGHPVWTLAANHTISDKKMIENQATICLRKALEAEIEKAPQHASGVQQ